MTDATIAPPRASATAARPGTAVALVGALIFTLAAVHILASGRVLGDADTQWHIASGDWMARNLALPHADMFSHTFAGQPWIAKEWLAQLLLAGADALFGWTGVAMLAAFAVAAALALLFRAAEREVGLLGAVLAVLLAFLFLQTQILARPHILVMPLAVLWIAGLAQTVANRRRPPFALAAVMLLWTNLHGTAPLALVALGAFAFDAVLSARAGERRAALAGWTAFALVASAAWLATPYGLTPVRVFLAMSGGSNEGVPLIQEWQPLSLDLVNGVAVVALAVALVGLGVRPRRHLGRIALCLFMSYLAARYGRFQGLAGLFVIGTALGPLGASSRLSRPVVGPAGARLLAAALAGAVCLLAAVPFLAPQAPLPRVAPQSALAAARSAGLLGAPVYNSYDFGGFLVAEGVPTFVDGRTDQLFLGGFLRELTTLMDAARPEGFLRFVEGHGARWAIVSTTGPEARHFAAAMPRWRPVYRDAEASVFALAP